MRLADARLLVELAPVQAHVRYVAGGSYAVVLEPAPGQQEHHVDWRCAVERITELRA